MRAFRLRCGVRVNADTPEHRAAYGRLAIVVHTLKHVRPDGLPEPAYNQSLAAVDADVVESLEANGQGLVVLVETFQGERSLPRAAAERQIRWAKRTEVERVARVVGGRAHRLPEAGQGR